MVLFVCVLELVRDDVEAYDLIEDRSEAEADAEVEPARVGIGGCWW